MSESGYTNIPHSLEGPCGVNGKPFVDMEPFLKTENFNELHQEAVFGLSQIDRYDLAFIVGEIPPKLRDQYQGMYLEAEILSNIERFDTSGIHREKMKNMTVQQRRRYCYLALGALSPWYGTCYLRRNGFHKKTTEASVEAPWTDEAQHFPQIVKYIESLKGPIFQDIGRVLFFISYPLNPVVVHRDFSQVKHKDHCINFFFNKGRPSFIYNELTEEQVYLDKDCRAYFFNNRDYHGVDAEPEMRYTLRVDGTFTDQFSKKIGLVDGWVY